MQVVIVDDDDDDAPNAGAAHTKSALPRHWLQMPPRTNVCFVEVMRGSDELARVLSTLAENGRKSNVWGLGAFSDKHKVIKVERIQNPALWASFSGFKDAKTQQDKDPNEVCRV